MSAMLTGATVSVIKINDSKFAVCWGERIPIQQKFFESEADARNHAAWLLRMLPLEVAIVE